MIRSFRNRATREVWEGWTVPGLPLPVQRAARRKLRMIDNAQSLQDLRSPPGNRLEALRRDRRGQHSVRVNDQWRVCFRWADTDAYDVEIVDYH